MFYKEEIPQYKRQLLARPYLLMMLVLCWLLGLLLSVMLLLTLLSWLWQLLSRPMSLSPSPPVFPPPIGQRMEGRRHVSAASSITRSTVCD